MFVKACVILIIMSMLQHRTDCVIVVNFASKLYLGFLSAFSTCVVNKRIHKVHTFLTVHSNSWCTAAVTRTATCIVDMTRGSDRKTQWLLHHY